MKTNEHSLLSLLQSQNFVFYIPPFQRNYEWDEDQCKSFLNDIRKCVVETEEGKPAGHFYGSIVFEEKSQGFGKPKKLILIDGQQRITTAMLFLAAVRDCIENPEFKLYIDNNYLKNEKVSGGSEFKVKLKQVESDWEVYKKIILDQSIHKESEKNTHIYKNYIYFVDSLKPYKDDQEYLVRLIEDGLEKFRITTVELEPLKNNWENPQEIFESLNSLGKPLSLGDLVRNYLLMGLSEKGQEDYYRDYWLPMEKKIPDHLSSYIRDYMQMKQSESFLKATESNYKSLYYEFKKLYGNTSEEEMLKDLEYNSNYYSWILGLDSTGDQKVDKALAELRELNITIAYSFLMEIMSQWKDGKLTRNETVELLKVLRIYFLRRRICGVSSSGENKMFPPLIRRFPEIIAAPDKGKALFKILTTLGHSSRMPNDKEVRDVLQSTDFYSLRNSKGILASVEESLSGAKPDLSSSDLQLEHIMPQSLSESWKQSLGPDYKKVWEEYLNNIGNLTLVRHNSKIGNRPFSEKKEIYDNNEGLILSRKMITDNEKWDKEAILKRQKWIIDYIIDKIIPVPEENKDALNYSQVRKNSRAARFEKA